MAYDDRNDGMKQSSQNKHEVTLNGQTKTVTGANSGHDAARQAFGSDGDRATTRKTETQRWL